MPEQPLITRRGIASAIPLAALAGAPAIALAPAASDESDAALLDLDRRWEAAWAAVVEHDQLFSSAMTDAAARAHEAIGEQLYEVERALFDAIVATPARTVGDLEVKSKALARTLDVEDITVDAIEAALGDARELTTRAGFSLVLDILKLARSMA